MHLTGTYEQWLEARKELLLREKKFSQERDAITRLRQALPWVKVEKNYEFDELAGTVTLGQLFGDRSQLLVYHFMLGPETKEVCTGCSFMMDNLPANRAHLEQKDLRFVVISRAPIAKIESYKRRMG